MSRAVLLPVLVLFLMVSYGNAALAQPEWYNMTTDFPLRAPDIRQSYQFNITWNSSGTNITVFIENDFSGNMTNYTVNSSSNGTYYYTYGSLPPGTYNWREFANGPSGEWNVTDGGAYRTFDVYHAALVPGSGLIDLSIAQKTLGKIKSISNKPYIYVSETLFVGIEFENTGSTTYDEYTDIFVKSSNLTNIYQFRSPVNYNVRPGDVVMENITVIPPDKGIFYIQARAMYGGVTTEAWSMFRSIYPGVCGNGLCEPDYGENYKNCPSDCQKPVCGNGYCEIDENYQNCPNDCYPPVCGNGVCEYGENYLNCPKDCPWYVLPPVTPSAPSSSTAPPVVQAAPEIGKADMSIDYPQYIEAYTGATSSAYMIVNNTGNITLSNVNLQFTADNFGTFGISPKIVSSLPRNRSSIFLVSFNVFNDTSVGNRTIFFTASSNQTRPIDGKIYVDVRSNTSDEADSLDRQIANYKFLIVKVQGELDDDERDGLNVTEARQYIDDANARLNAADGYTRSGDFAKAKGEIDKVLDDINNAIYKASIASVTIVSTAYSNVWILIVAILLGLIPIAVVFLLRKRGKRRPAMLERAEKGEGE